MSDKRMPFSGTETALRRCCDEAGFFLYRLVSPDAWPEYCVAPIPFPPGFPQQDPWRIRGSVTIVDFAGTTTHAQCVGWLRGLLATGRPASAGLIDLDGQTLEEAFAAAATAMRDAPLPVDDERIAGCVGETWKRALAHAEEASHAAQDAPAAEDAAAPAGDGLLHPDPIFLAPLPSAAGKAPGAPA